METIPKNMIDQETSPVEKKCKLKTCPNFNRYYGKYCSPECKREGANVSRRKYLYKKQGQFDKIEELEGKPKNLREKEVIEKFRDVVAEQTLMDEFKEPVDSGEQIEEEVQEPIAPEEQPVETSMQAKMDGAYKRLLDIDKEIGHYISVHYDSAIRITTELEKFFKQLRSTRRYFLDYKAKGYVYYELLVKSYERLYIIVDYEEDSRLKSFLFKLIDAFEDFKLSFDTIVMEMEEEQ